MQSKHTAGSWHAHDGQIYPEETGQTIATVHYFDKTNEEHQANQRLIAAAPDMLAALELIKYKIDQSIIDYDSEIYRTINAAIQKATQP